jgi:hypothetical protein
MMQYGNGREAPPALTRESIELQRAGSRIALGVRNRFPEDRWINIEADISPVLMRLVFHYGDGDVAPRSKSELRTVELNLHPGHPIDDLAWVNSLIDDVLALIYSGESDLIIPQPLNYIRLCDVSGQTIFEEGRAIEFRNK